MMRLCAMMLIFAANKTSITREMEHQYYMKQAFIEAQKAAEKGEIPIGAIITCQGHIIARAHNLTQTLQDVTAHAEMQAITAAANTLGAKYLTDCTLYVTVEPCSMCAAAIGWAQIPQLVYGTDDLKRGYRRFAPEVLHPKTEVVSGIMQQECASIVSDFFRKLR